MAKDTSGWLLDELISPGARLTQGDLIKFEEAKDPLRKIGIVVTADCDLEQKKHAKLITLIPVVPVQILMENYFLPEDCEKKREQIENYAFKHFEISNISETEAMKAILKEKVGQTATEKDHPSVIAAKFVLDQMDVISIKQYKTLMEAVKTGLKKADSLSQQIRARGDLLILPSTVELGINGDIGWVRHIWQVPLNAIAIRTSEVSSREGEKIARLDSPYRYRLTQLMAQVFSDIGLPNVTSSLEDNIREAYEHA